MQALHEAGHSVHVINPLPYCPIVDSLLKREKVADETHTWKGMSVHCLPHFYTPGCFIHKHHIFYRAAVRPVLQRYLKNISNEEKPHIILGFIYPDAVAMAPLCEALNLDYSVRVNGSDFRIRIQQPSFRDQVMSCLHRAPRIFCPGNALKDDMVSSGIAKDKIVPFNNGVNQNIFHESNPGSKTSQDRRYILFVGNLADVKAPHRLIEAHARLIKADPSYKNIELDIIGEGSLKAVLKNQTQQAGTANSVHFLGKQTPEFIADKMRHALCLCLCSRSEGMPNVVIEALACGCPVVTTDVGETPYLIENGKNGYLTESKEKTEESISQELALNFQNILSKQWDRVTIAQSMKTYTWETAAKEITQAITV